MHWTPETRLLKFFQREESCNRTRATTVTTYVVFYILPESRSPLLSLPVQAQCYTLENVVDIRTLASHLAQEFCSFRGVHAIIHHRIGQLFCDTSLRCERVCIVPYLSYRFCLISRPLTGKVFRAHTVPFKRTRPSRSWT